MAIETFISLNTKQQLNVEFEDIFIGSGQQGKVYTVKRVNGQDSDSLLIKIYDDQSKKTRDHAIEFAKYIEAKGLCSEGLSGLCSEQLSSLAGNRFAFFMRRVPGRTLDDPDVYRWLRQQSLAVRLSIAYQVAYSIARLHTERVIHADIADPNIVIDEQNQTAYVIDADGGGVLDHNGQFLPKLAPLVRGHRSGALMAPELVKDDYALPSEESDNWSLAVMVHKILFCGIDPFFFLPKFLDCLDAKVEWPPTPKAVDPNRQRAVQLHAQLLLLMGKRIKELFCSSFSPWGRLYNPSIRTQAKTWAQELEIASRWVWQCKCGNEMVAMETTHCPICRSEIPHAKLSFGSKHIFINTEGQSLQSRDLGFTDGQYEVLSFCRNGEQLQIYPKTPLILSSKKYPPGKPVRVGPGKYNLAILSKSKKEKAEITLQAP
jgi:serine/threonine protein kinase